MTSLKQQFDAFDYVAPLILALVASTAFSLMTLLMYCCCFRKCFDKDRHSLLQKMWGSSSRFIHRIDGKALMREVEISMRRQ